MNKKAEGGVNLYTPSAGDTTESFELNHFWADAETLGLELKAAREAQGLSLSDVSERLRLDEQVLQAMEAGDRESLSFRRPVYLERHYSGYARLLRVPVEHTRFALESNPAVNHTRATEVDITSAPVENLSFRLSDYSDAIIISLVTVMLLTVGGVIWWVRPDPEVQLEENVQSAVDPAIESEQFSERDDSYYILGDLDDGERDSTEATGSTSSSDSAGTTNATVRDSVTLDQERTSTELETIAFPRVADIENPTEVTGTAEAETEGQADSSALDTEGVQTESLSTGLVFLEFSDDCWVEIYDAKNDLRFQDLGTSGRTATITGLLPMRVRIGDYKAVTLTFNNEPIDLSAYAIGSVANFTLQ